MKITLTALLLSLFTSSLSLAMNDPTRPPHWTPAFLENPPYGDFVLSGIFNSSGHFAVINGKKFYEGDTVGSYELTKIGKDQIYLRHSEDVLIIPLTFSPEESAS
jgi:hypothetical protein